MNRTIIALIALLPAGQLAAAPPSPKAPTPTPTAVEQRIINSETSARQRELEIRLEVQEHQNPKVQAEFAAMMEELDQSKDQTSPAPAAEAPAR